MSLLARIGLGDQCPKCLSHSLQCVGHTGSKTQSIFHYECLKCGNKLSKDS